MTTTYYTGPTNDCYGYDLYSVVRADHMEAVVHLRGDELWGALERLDWIPIESIPAGAVCYRTYSPDGESLRLTNTPALLDDDEEVL